MLCLNRLVHSLKQTAIASLLVSASWLMADVAQAASPQTTAAARLQQRQQQVQQVRPENYDLSRHPVTDDSATHWRNLLWTTAIVEPQEPFVAAAIAQILTLTQQSSLSTGQQRTVEMALQVGTQLYLSDPTLYVGVGLQFLHAIERSPNPEWAAMALSALMQAGLADEQRQQLSQRLRQRFPQWQENVYLSATLREAALRDRPADLPPLADLLNWTIAPGQPQLYVFCQPDRGTLCRAALKDRSGAWVQQQGSLWQVPLLLRSIHGLSWVFTRGQTPQGVYRMEGTRPPNPDTLRAYGAFPLVKLFVPLEAGVREFIPGQGAAWSGGLAAYQSLLPPSWRGYFPMQQSYWAGRAGRGLFRIHGSGEAPSFFTNNSRYPESNDWNPTIGCLSALELYDETGRIERADMPQILAALQAASGQDLTGYLIVVEVPGMDWAQVEAAIAAAAAPSTAAIVPAAFMMRG